MDNRTSPSTYLSKPGEICEYLASVIAEVPSVDAASVTAVDAAVGYELGIYIDRQRNVLNVVSEIMESVNGFPTFTRADEFAVGVVTDPSLGTALETFDSTNILSIQKKATVRPSRQIFINYARAWRVQNLNQVAAAVSDAVREFIIQQYRTAPSTNNPIDITTVYPLADEERYDTLIAGAADAATEADRLQTLFGVQRKVFTVSVKTQPFRLNLGDVVNIEDTRFSLTPARNYAIIGLDEDSLSGVITMTLWG